MNHLKYKMILGIQEGDSVIDIGCGNADYWENVLSETPSLKLALVEPNQEQLAEVRERYSSYPLITFHQNTRSLPDFYADKIFSFSVLEHVWNRDEFFSEAVRLLKNSGTFFFNYDDGHFRKHLYRDRPLTYRLKNELKTSLYWLWPTLGMYSKYQYPVQFDEVNDLLLKHGLRIVNEQFYDPEGLYKLHKLFATDLAVPFEALVNRFVEEIGAAMNSYQLPLPKDQFGVIWNFFASRGLTVLKDLGPSA